MLTETLGSQQGPRKGVLRSVNAKPVGATAKWRDVPGGAPAKRHGDRRALRFVSSNLFRKLRNKFQLATCGW